MRTRLSGSIGLVVASVLMAAPTGAQQADLAAAALFKEGREALKGGAAAAACPKLAESFRLDPAAGTLLNLADCEERLGRLTSAWQHFELAAEKLVGDEERLPIARKRSAALLPRLPRLSIWLSAGAPPGTTVARDGVDLGAGSLAAPLPVDPGDHVVVVTAPGRAPRRFTVTVREAEPQRLDVAPGDPAPSADGHEVRAPAGRHALHQRRGLRHRADGQGAGRGQCCRLGRGRGSDGRRRDAPRPRGPAARVPRRGSAPAADAGRRRRGRLVLIREPRRAERSRTSRGRRR